jgi:hypothetical protein
LLRRKATLNAIGIAIAAAFLYGKKTLVDKTIVNQARSGQIPQRQVVRETYNQRPVQRNGRHEAVAPERPAEKGQTEGQVRPR